MVKGVDRYEFPDAYIVEELRQKYQSSDAKGRIRLLRKLYKNGRDLPFELARLAVEDPHVEVRQWIARHGKSLDYRESRYVDGQRVYEFPERNLNDCLKNDPDPFVHACLRENPNAPFGGEESFQDIPHMERLAFMRNPELGSRFSLLNDKFIDLIEKIFDHEDQELGIDLEARKELIRALLTNTAVLNASKRLSPKDFDTGSETFDSIDWLVTHGRSSSLWERISKSPGDHEDIQKLVYQYLGASDETKAQIYQACDVPSLGFAILMGCGTDDLQTIALGLKDTYDLCRTLAYEKFDPRRFVSHQTAALLLHSNAPTSKLAEGIQSVCATVNATMASVLQGEDKAALRGLARNQTLDVSTLKMVEKRLSELGGKSYAWEVRQRLKNIREAQAPEAPKELFGEEGRQSKFLEDKINFIGKQLITTSHATHQISRAINWIKIGLILPWAVLLTCAVLLWFAWK